MANPTYIFICFLIIFVHLSISDECQVSKLSVLMEHGNILHIYIYVAGFIHPEATCPGGESTIYSLSITQYHVHVGITIIDISIHIYKSLLLF